MKFANGLVGLVGLVVLLLPAAAMGQGAGPDAQAAALVAQSSSAANNIFQSIGDMLKGTRMSELLIEGSGKLPENLQAQFDRLDPEVVDKLVQAGGMSCAAVTEAQKVLLFIAGKYAALGIDARASISNALSALDPAHGKCEEDAKAECKAKADPSILVAFWTRTTRTSAVAGTATDTATPAMLKRAERICTPKSYRIAGNAGPMQVSGTACSLEEPFTVKGGGGGMTVQFSYAPGGETGGKMSYTGGGSGVKMAGAGTYTVTLDGKGGTLKQTHSGRVLMPGGGSATHTDTLKLTRLEPPC